MFHHPPGPKKVQANVRAGLQFSISKIKKIFNVSLNVNAGTPLKLNIGAQVYLTAIVEYICAELCELAGNHARDNKRSRIKIEDIKKAINADSELTTLYGYTVNEFDKPTAAVGVSTIQQFSTNNDDCNSLHLYIMRVVKQVHPDVGCGKDAKNYLAWLLIDLIKQFHNAQTCLDGVKTSVRANTIQSLANILLSGEMKKHAIEMGTKAFTKFTSSHA